MSQSTAKSNGQDSSTTQASSTTSSPSKQRQVHTGSFNDSEVDPWASSAAPRSQTQPVLNDSTPDRNVITAARPLISTSATRTTSAFTTSAHDPDASSKMTGTTLGDNAAGSTAGAWGGPGNPGFPDTNPSGLGGAGFGSNDRGDQPNARSGRSFGANLNPVNRAVEESVTITILPEKEGMFMFQHRNYEVKSPRRGSSVVRRYSDFVWLLDCLHKRYPFRQLPLLPPKRVACMIVFA